MQTHEIRNRFIQHFVKAGHTEVPSASLVLDDPNLLFVNAGMVPFKPYFLGNETPDFSTATSIQKCVRTLDIEEVGITTRHNTFFQMAGNFSFGNYFKEGAITHAWSLLTGAVEDGGFGIPAEKLWVTVFLDDDEAHDIWHEKVGVSEERIQRRGMADNYWSMGVPGPCGPCSEIFYDRGPEYGADGGPEADEDRYIEIWNLVFMENERGEGTGKDSFEILGPLPKKNIDTGMGIERVAFLLQGVDNVYETDLLRPVIDEAERLTGSKYSSNHQDNIRFRVIADHSRTGLMLMLDGVTPSNSDRGYILRRLLRRIIRSARLLGANGPVLEKLIGIAAETMTPSYPEIAENWNRIRRVAVAEEKTFTKTLSAGEELFERAATKAKAEGKTVLSGHDAFTLHDTHGFPIDLTIEMAEEAGLTIDREEFDREMAEQRARAKADSQAKKQSHTDLHVYREFIDEHPTSFTGYDRLADESTILGIIADGQKQAFAAEGDEIEVILDRTPLYAEAGGQLADRGRIVTDSGAVVHINDVQKVGKKLWLHKGIVTAGEFTPGVSAEALVDEQWRHGARQAHTATHLIHGALRQVLGDTATQAGSMNKPGYLRFDFKYGEQLTPEQLREIEQITNEAVDNDWAVNTAEMPLEEAKAAGAMALFNENYGDIVRVVEVGGPFSIELCGGTHVSHSSQIGPVAVLGESSVGSGVRRIEAYSGIDSFRYLSTERLLAERLATEFKAPSAELPDRIAALAEKLKAAEKQLADFKAGQLLANAASHLESARTIGDVTYLGLKLPDGTEMKDIRSLANDLAKRLADRPSVIALISNAGGKVPFVASVSDEAVNRGIKAGDLVKLMGAEVGGKGGGKPAMAQGSGSDTSGIDAALAAVEAELSK
ncbi:MULTISPECIES: alanine--tRNA ligase [unclassified Corynebacterium]|uniref:alanine--tRNA ligase n=1 Tax=unclassified Corynebacterium TaxID=2624378 RepID=UPI000B1D1D59|nr:MULTISPECIES: alanine--tRNA ligase [unclassified Corynebacterium]MDK8849907.1 alanine--tRNA ligase [Corynebacterium sp. MSK019]